MKRLLERITDKNRQLFEVLILVAVAIIPSLFDFQAVIAVSNAPELDPLSLLTYYAGKSGNLVIGAFLAIAVLHYLRKANSKKAINCNGNYYHEHGMLWYQFCSKVLGYRTCCLARVPIAVQFKLVLHDVFDEYTFGAIDPISEEESDSVAIDQLAAKDGQQEQKARVNLLISDTYPINLELLPEECRSNETIVIRRTANETSSTRRYSPKLVDAVTNLVRQLPMGSEVSIFATTNPKNTYEIVEKAFKTGGRDNLNALYVYKQQDGKSKDAWRFVKATKIYDKA